MVPLSASDAADFWHAVERSRGELQRFLPWTKYVESKDGARKYVQGSASEWATGRALRFSLRSKRGGEFVGVVGLEHVSPLHESADLGYWLSTHMRGEGLITEAARCVVRWGFSYAALHRLRVAVATDNYQSLAVVSRLGGFRFEGISRQAERCDGRWLDHAVFARISTDDER